MSSVLGGYVGGRCVMGRVCGGKGVNGEGM